MRSGLRNLFLFLALLAIVCSPALAYPEAEVSADNAYAHVEFLVNIAPRLAGSDNENLAVRYIENEFLSYGLEVSIENFAVHYYVVDNQLRKELPENLDNLTWMEVDSISYNVIAILPGESNEVILINAHHDSVVTPGAVDDASGVAVVLEIARVLSDEKLQRTVMFVTFGGEEIGLLGSADFVHRHGDLNIRAAISFDCIGDGPDDGLRVGLEGPGETTGWLDAYVRKIAKESLGLEAPAEHYEELKGVSDHLSFTRADIAATWVYWVTADERGILYPIHTPGDNLDVISKERLEQVATLGVALVRRLAAEDIDRWIWMYGLPIRQAVFAVINLCVVVISIGSTCFVHYRRGWTWRRAALVFALVIGAVAVVTYLELLVYEFSF